MDYVNFFGHQVSKLILGDNPITGHSYIKEYVPGKEMIEYYTTARVIELLFHAEELGINTMLPLSDPYIVRVLGEYRRAGGKMNFIFQPVISFFNKATMRNMLEVEPIGIYHQGTTTDYNYETGNNQKTFDMIKQFRQMDIPVGLGTHRPDVIEQSEREGWEVDFYLACMQNARKGREGEQSGFITGKSKAGLIFYPEDRPVMLDTLKNIKKPIITFKIFAGGQMLVNKKPEEKKKIIKGVYGEIFNTLKPDDFAAVGVFQRDEDQLRENVELYNEWSNERK